MLEPKDEIRQKLDVADFISGYLTLKPSGSGSFKGLCPFHAEHTPSFHVSRERQIWHCFGCDKGGDVFAFAMEMEGMTFPEALKHLAEKTGVVLPEYTQQPKQIVDAKESLLAMHDVAQKFYAKILESHADALEARAYLEGRGIDRGLVQKFGLGYAPDRWDSLVQFLGGRGFSSERIIESGLGLRKKTGEGLVDRFRYRIMIPLCDALGNVVGFTARIMATPGKTTMPDGPKYMNSPESPLYHKGRMLYGLHLAKQAIRTEKSVIIVEGNLDVIASHKAGVENVVASSGTALTEEQLRVLSRYTSKLIFSLDGDAAGIAAAKRVFDLAVKLEADPNHRLDVDIRCLLIPPSAGKDPDDVVQKSPDLWRDLAKKSHAVIEFFFEHALKAYEAQAESASIDERKQLVRQLLPEIAKLVRADERHLYLLRVADATHVPLDVLMGMLGEVSKEERGPAFAKATAGKKRDKRDDAAEFLFGLACHDESIIPELQRRLPVDALPLEPWQRLYTQLFALYTPDQYKAAGTQSLFSRLREALSLESRVDDILLIDRALLTVEEQVAPLSAEHVRAELDLHITLFNRAARDTQRRRLEAAIRDAEHSGAGDTLRMLLAEYHTLLNAPYL